MSRVHGTGKEGRREAKRPGWKRPRGPLGLAEFAGEQKAQISAELIIVIAALVAVAMVLVSQLQKSAKQGSDALEKKTNAVWDEIDKIK